MKSNWIHCKNLVFRNRLIIFPGSRIGRELVWPTAARLAGPSLGLWLLWGRWQEICLLSLWGGLISSQVPSQTWPALPAKGGIPQERTKGALSSPIYPTDSASRASKSSLNSALFLLPGPQPTPPPSPPPPAPGTALVSCLHIPPIPKGDKSS